MPKPAINHHKLQGYVQNGRFITDQANGFLKLSGKSDLEFGIGGVGDIDIASANNGNPSLVQGTPVDLPGHTIKAGNGMGMVTFQPYYRIDYSMVTLNGVDGYDTSNSTVSFDGELRARVITDFGDFVTVFPSDDDENGSNNEDRQPNSISIPEDNVLYSATKDGGKIALSAEVNVGLKTKLSFSDGYEEENTLPDVSLYRSEAKLIRYTDCVPQIAMGYTTLTEFSFSQEDDSGPCSEITVVYVTTSSSDLAIVRRLTSPLAPTHIKRQGTRTYFTSILSNPSIFGVANLLLVVVLVGLSKDWARL